MGAERASRFWAPYEDVRDDCGVVDYPETLRRFRRTFRGESRLADLDRAVLDVPFERYLYPRALDVIASLWQLGEPAILSDGDRVYQPMKIARAGILLAVRGNVLIYEHKENHLNEVRRRFAAERYAHIEDKAALLARTKAALGDRRRRSTCAKGITRANARAARSPTSSSSGSPIF